jgi:C-terminal processing protease CtpA/Prc
MHKILKVSSLILLVAFMQSACSILSTPTQAPTAAPTTEPTPVASNEPYELTGSFDYTNSVITDYYVEQAVALVDMYGFITRDLTWEIPVASQTLGYLNLDATAMHGDYTLQLPARPTATQADVDNNSLQDTGVQVFAVSYWPNLYGGPYSEGDDKSYGWPTYLASIITDSENKDEVTGGKLVVWAPDGNESFPTGFGNDGLLFTADDPVASIQAGWTIVDLDQSPFAFVKQLQPELTLYEPKDAAIKDYSSQSYTEAFDSMFQFVKTNYAFNDVEGKHPDWDALYASIQPRIAQAETAKDANAFYFALLDFTYAFKDGHIGLVQNDVWSTAFSDATAGGFGFSIRELDDGRFLNIYLSDNGPAALVGMKVGAEITEFNGKPISEAVSEVKPWTLPESLDSSIRYQQVRYLLRTTPGTQATVKFVNPGGAPQTATLTAISERDSFARTSVYYGVDTTQWLLPVDFKLLDSGVGYIGIRSNYDDLNLVIKLFERALKTFEADQVPGVVIDLRYNSGGAPLGLAGFLTNQEIPMGQLEYYSETTGKFEPEGLPDRVLPNVEQYSFDKIVVLVGPACASACELEAYGFSKLSNAQVVGMFPSAGTEAEVSRGQVEMPEGNSLQFPTGRFINEDGSIFLEGVGVQPTLRVPITEENVMTTDDIVLQFGERAVLEPLGAGITPATQPTFLTQDETNTALSSAKQFEDLARETYTNVDYLKVPNNFPFTVTLSKSQTLLWAWGWCAKDQATLDNNLGRMDVKFVLNGQDVSLDQFYKMVYDSSDGQKCTAYLLGVKDWAGGQHKAVTTLTFKTPLNDGTYDFPAGKQVFEYNIYVKP